MTMKVGVRPQVSAFLLYVPLFMVSLHSKRIVPKTEELISDLNFVSHDIYKPEMPLDEKKAVPWAILSWEIKHFYPEMLTTVNKQGIRFVCFPHLGSFFM